MSLPENLKGSRKMGYQFQASKYLPKVRSTVVDAIPGRLGQREWQTILSCGHTILLRQRSKPLWGKKVRCLDPECLKLQTP